MASSQLRQLQLPAAASHLSADNELFHEFWATQGYDEHFGTAIEAILAKSDADALLAHISGRRTRIDIVRPSTRKKWAYQSVNVDDLHDAIETEIANTDPNNGFIGQTLHSFNEHDLQFLYVIVPERSQNKVSTEREWQLGEYNYCCVVFHSRGEEVESVNSLHEQTEENEEESNSCNKLKRKSDTESRDAIMRMLRMVYAVIRRRERRFSPFPARISARYLNDAVRCRKPAGEKEPDRGLRAPWESPDESHRTVTLSFDLRKSTFCMAYVDDPRKFARWLDDLVGIMTEVCHMHGGVFDKFTGDGCLVHFLEREYQEVYRTTSPEIAAPGNPGKLGLGTAADNASAVHAALDCAIDMQRAMQKHIRRLRHNLRMDSDLLGAGVAIGCSDAYWSVDHNDSPIVVGPGVVDACRLCDKAKRGQIMMANNAYFSLPKRVLNRLRRFKRTPVITKELDKEIKVAAWVLDRSATKLKDLGKGDNVVSELCERIYSRAMHTQSSIV